jgi:molybdate transport system ATP-binding protein
MTLKCIAGIEKPDEGRIVLDGNVLFDSEKHIDLAPQKRRVGYLFQQYALFPNMTVRQNIAVGCREKDKAKRDAAVAEKIRAFRLEGLEKKRPSQLSGGQQQRTALARILINEPELLLLDEPFSALDSYLKWQVELELSDILAQFGGTTLFVSHSRDEVYRLCENVCVLDHGKSEPTRPVQALFDRPETLSACLLSGCKNYSRISRISDTRVSALDWGAELTVLPDSPEDAELLGVRAHYIAISRESRGENSFPARVERVVEDVFSTIVMFDTGRGGEYARIRAELSKSDWEQLAGAETLYLTIAPQDIMLLNK